MKALMLVESENDPVQLVELEKPGLVRGQVLVRMKAAALNRRDYWILKGKYPGLKFNSILGSDGCGVVERVHDQENIKWEGEEVIINPNVNWGDNPDIQSDEYHVLGMPDHGTFSEYMALSIENLHIKPHHLSIEEAAALPLCGLTAYRALMHYGKLTQGHKILITGIGGGVAKMAFQFALHKQAIVYVNSGSEEKIARSIADGAVDGFNYKLQNWVSTAIEKANCFDLIIDSTGGSSINDYIKLIKPGGKIIVYGATTGKPPELDIYRLFWKQVTIQGSTMGSNFEFKKMIEFVDEHKIIPIIDSVTPFDNIMGSFDRMDKGKQNGKLVVSF